MFDVLADIIEIFIGLDPSFRASHQLVAELLREAEYSLQGNRKTVEGNQHPDRNAQFEFIAAAVKSAQRRKQPAISVDTKKKELVGDFKNAGVDWCPVGRPTEVRVHDFPDAELGKAIPYGVYDLRANAGFVSVGIDHDTAAFAAMTIRRWWWRMGRPLYPEATELLVTAVAAMRRAPGYGKWSCRSWPMTSG